MRKAFTFIAALTLASALAACQTTQLEHADDARYKFVSTSGGDVEYFHVDGTGDVGIVVLHGDVSKQADTVNIIRVSFRQVTEQLNAEFGVPAFAIARPGNGRTVGGTSGKSTYEEKSLGRVIEAIEGLSKAYGLKKVDLVGFSGGGATAVMIAMKRPNLVHKVVVYGAEVDPLRMKAQRKSNPKRFSASDFPITPAKMIDDAPVSQSVDYRFLFGTEDEVIPIKLGREFVDEMKAKGFNATFKAVEGTSHYDFMPRNGDTVQAAIRAELKD